MSEVTTPKRRPKSSPRRHSFSVEGQLRGKLGNKGYAQLLDALQLATRKRRPRRRKSAAV